MYVRITAEDEADQLLSVFEEPQIVRSNAMMLQVSVRPFVLLCSDPKIYTTIDRINKQCNCNKYYLHA